MKLALILNAVVPTIGGVLIRGEKGTGKSTAVRALARLLPEHNVVEGCHFGCDPDDREALCAECRIRLHDAGVLPSHKRRMRVVELPINASEDRVVGTIDIEAALRAGARRFEPGVLAEANAAVKQVRITSGQARLISSICVEADVLGHRADVVIDHAARALAAYRRHTSPSREDIYDAATLALAHRARQPIRRDQDENSSPQTGEEQEGSQPADSQAGEPQPSDSEAPAEASADESSSASDGGQQSAGSDQGMTSGGSSAHESAPDATEMFNLRRIDLPRQRRVRKQGGKRSASQTPDRRGRYVRAEPKAKVNDLAIDATVRAAAPMQKERGRLHGERLKLEREDLRQKVRERKVGNLIVFVVDASASMDAEQRMAGTKGAILSLLQDAYVRRDRVSGVSFQNRTAEVVLRPTSSVSLARRRLEKL